MDHRALTMLNEMGDTTICWTADRDDEMEAIIRKKMAEGVTFFIVEERDDGLPAGRRAITEPAEARAKRAVSIPDEDFARFVETGAGATATAPPSGRIRRSRVTRSPREAAQAGDVVGAKQRKGG